MIDKEILELESTDIEVPEKSNNGLHHGDEMLTADDLAEILGELDAK